MHADLFWKDYFERYRFPLPEKSCQWQFTEDLVRFIGPGKSRHDYSVAMKRDVADEGEQRKIVKQEKEIALSERDVFEWKTFENPRTPYLTKALEEEGFRCIDRSTLLYWPSELTPARASRHPSIRVEKITSLEDFSRLKTILLETWGVAEQPFVDALHRSANGDGGDADVFLVSYDGVAVCCGWTKHYGTIAHFFGGSTIPSARGKGAYKALALERIKAAKQRGATYVVSECSADSERVLRKLGFFGAGQVFRYVYQKSS